MAEEYDDDDDYEDEVHTLDEDCYEGTWYAEDYKQYDDDYDEY